MEHTYRTYLLDKAGNLVPNGFLNSWGDDSEEAVLEAKEEAPCAIFAPGQRIGIDEPWGVAR